MRFILVEHNKIIKYDRSERKNSKQHVDILYFNKTLFKNIISMS